MGAPELLGGPPQCAGEHLAGVRFEVHEDLVEPIEDQHTVAAGDEVEDLLDRRDLPEVSGRQQRLDDSLHPGRLTNHLCREVTQVEQDRERHRRVVLAAVQQRQGEQLGGGRLAHADVTEQRAQMPRVR